MHLINKNSDYAIRALVYMAKNKNHHVSSKEISENEHIPLHFLRRLLQQLVKAGYVESREGKSGGVKLIRDSSDISVKEVVELFQGKIKLSDCFINGDECFNIANCKLRNKILEVEKYVANSFGSISINELCD